MSVKIKAVKVGDYNFVPYHNKTREEWEIIRRSFKTKLGGSDVGTIMGVNDRASKAVLFDQKLGLAPPPDLSENQSVFWGHAHEPTVREASNYYRMDSPNDRNYMVNHRQGKKQNNHVAFDYTVYSDYIPWLAANVDGLNVDDYWSDEDIHELVEEMGELPSVLNVVEFKTMSGQVYDKWHAKISGDYKGLPPAYIMQVMTYMIVFQSMYSHDDHFSMIYSLVDGHKLHAYRVDWDQKLVDQILEETYKFHLLLNKGIEILDTTKFGSPEQKKLLDEIRPEPDATLDYRDHLSKNYLSKIDISKEMVGDSYVQELRDKYVKVNALSKENDSEKLEISNKIREYLMKNEVRRVNLDEGKINFTSNSRLLIK